MTNSQEYFDDDELSGMLASIDHPVPPLEVGAVIRRARIRSGRRSALLAAAALIMVASIATATVPGSLGRRYLREWLDRRSASRTPAVAVQARGDGADDAASRGIAFAPGPQVDIDFKWEQSAGALQVRWADVAKVMLSQTGSQSDAHYALMPNGVIVDNAGSRASYSLVLPRTLERARVRVAGKVVLSKEGQTLSCAGVHADTGSCVIEVGAGHSK
ncbi:MAG: hypothetical protein H0U66_15490 [Gemmatimonadaceae bacterium]|nr:hypothetical protein [Gemmatimonadaceae bacterium]